MKRITFNDRVEDIVNSATGYHGGTRPDWYEFVWKHMNAVRESERRKYRAILRKIESTQEGKAHMKRLAAKGLTL